MTTFPSPRRTRPLAPFVDRYAAKRDDLDLFNAAWNAADAALQAQYLGRDCRLPNALRLDWLATWAQDLFRLILPQHDRIPQAEAAGVIAEVVDVLNALRFVSGESGLMTAGRVWFYEMPEPYGRHVLPALDDVTGGGRLPNLDRTAMHDQQQFLDRAVFLFGIATAADWEWLARLAYTIDDRQDPALDVELVRNQVNAAVRGLVVSLGELEPDPAAWESLPLPAWSHTVRNWATGMAAAAAPGSATLALSVAMPLKTCAARFGFPARGLVERLDRQGIRLVAQ